MLLLEPERHDCFCPSDRSRQDMRRPIARFDLRGLMRDKLAGLGERTRAACPSIYPIAR